MQLLELFDLPNANLKRQLSVAPVVKLHKGDGALRVTRMGHACLAHAGLVAARGVQLGHLGCKACQLTRCKHWEALCAPVRRCMLLRSAAAALAFFAGFVAYAVLCRAVDEPHRDASGALGVGILADTSSATITRGA
eukprot:COSAG01_NODE_2855_length_6961_cov_3.612260_7_plen_137_part_00